MTLKPENQETKQKPETQEQKTLLQAYGWNEHWEAELQRAGAGGVPLVAARVVAQFSHQYRIVTEAGEQAAVVTGKFEFEAVNRGDFPAVGDWVLVQPLPGEARAVIHALLPRRSAMVRKEAGQRVDVQVISANLDYVFITNALNQDFNLRKIERYLLAVWESGAKPVVLLTKADLCDDPDHYAALVEGVAPGVPVHAVSAFENQGREALADYLLPGQTIAITGSSGVGKSTLLNWLADEEKQRVQQIRESDARGRHTTTHREMFVTPSGAIIVDTPGMRELQLWESDEGMDTTFSDIGELAASCRFHDCRHEREEGCAVKQAIADGTLEQRRFANFKKMEKELAHMARKEESVNRRTKKQAEKRVSAKSRVGRRTASAYAGDMGDDE
ncbi:ribosome biogenesis GTPase [Paenibacillus algorifonticola]|uniref:Small ribosomal subunit biogenesis GTPase RsgA n=1 Tax=Paenibacillus algorifonticola TaxID=684063 RepID=A0A1I2DHZ0_9BACL|nr:ribosome small subunit-dependent GTPase A [Paenibacillus algorifonticola]SFE79971.1 ribosome biogenesis GTPase [Paenibacillus algorifonticola]